MGTRIVHFGIAPSGNILAVLAANGYEVDSCGTSIPKLKQMLQQRDGFDAVSVAENSAPNALEILATVRSHSKVPFILLQDESRTCDPSQFDLAIPEHAALPHL